jgi:hypothetical protein
MKFLTLAVYLGMANSIVGTVNPAQDTWWNGYVAAFEKAATIKSWEEMWDWSEQQAGLTVKTGKKSRSTDLAGARHTYIDSFAAGYKDACINLLDEMRFIGNHNSGGMEHFFKIMKQWIKAQEVNKSRAIVEGTASREEREK